jgi:chromosomal replication initiation ATPase DnaA
MPPSRWMVGLADLRSRLNAAPAVAIGRPDDALIGAVLVKLFGDRQLPVDGEVLAYVLARMERSFAAARTLVAALDRAALAAHRGITIPLAREVTAALEDSNSGRE